MTIKASGIDTGVPVKEPVPAGAALIEGSIAAGGAAGACVGDAAAESGGDTVLLAPQAATSAAIAPAPRNVRRVVTTRDTNRRTAPTGVQAGHHSRTLAPVASSAVALHNVKTRTLLILAVACGLVILVAGSIKLFLVADADAPVHHAVGQSAKVADMVVTVEAMEIVDGKAVATVSLVGVDDDDGAQSWTFGDGQQLLSRNSPANTPSHNGLSACRATKRDEVTRCLVSFTSTRTRGVLRYDRADEALYWDVIDS